MEDGSPREVPVHRDGSTCPPADALRSCGTVTVLRAADTAERRCWEEIVVGTPGSDVYHRPGYALAYQAAGHGQAIALRVPVEGGAFLVPLIVRTLDALPFGRPFRGQDAVTPYGFGGVLPLQAGTPTDEQVEALCAGLRLWCLESNVLSVMLRLHPMLDQVAWLAPALARTPGFALRRIGPTQAIPVIGWDERKMDRNRRYNLRLAGRELRATYGAEGDAGGGPSFAEALDIFDRIYNSTMERLGATAFYRFPRVYLDTLARELPGRIAVGIAWLGSEPVGADLFLRGEALAHCHLSGTTAEGRARGAATLLVHGGVAWARSVGCGALHLGGGTSPNDDLLRFKRSFGGETYEYAFATLIADAERYAALSAARRASPEPLRPDFFPEYRA